MGEMADDIIEGNACPCGEYFEEEGDGYPRTCSKSCEKDYGIKC